MTATYLDSWWEPSAAAIAWAKSQGYVGWLGYFAEPNDNIYHGWQDATFRAVRAAGLQTAAYCSGWDNPQTVKQRAAALGISAILDVEASIRNDGPWVDPWLQASGAALYGLGPTIDNHRTHGHAGYVEAGYPSFSGTANPFDPGLALTVAMPSPARPVGRQFAGSVPTPFGSVDLSHFDPAFFGGVAPTQFTRSTSYMIVGPFTEAHDGQAHVYALGSDGGVYEGIGPDAASALTNLDLSSGHVQNDVRAIGGNFVQLTGQQFADGDVLLIATHADGSVVFASKNSTTGAWYGATAINGFTAKVASVGPPGPAGPAGVAGPPGTVAPFTATITPR